MVELAIAHFATDVDQCFSALNLVSKNLALNLVLKNLALKNLVSNRVVWLATDADRIGIKLTDVHCLSGCKRYDPANNTPTAICLNDVTETSCTDISCTETGRTDIINCPEIGHIDIVCTEIAGIERRNGMHHAG